MEHITGQLDLLIELQNKDLVIDRLKKRRDAVPQEIQDMITAASQFKNVLEERKKAVTVFQLARKEKEMELASKEEEIKKPKSTRAHHQYVPPQGSYYRHGFRLPGSLKIKLGHF